MRNEGYNIQSFSDGYSHSSSRQELCAAGNGSVEPERERGSSWGIIGYILRTGGVVVLRSVNTKTGFVNSDKK